MHGNNIRRLLRATPRRILFEANVFIAFVCLAAITFAAEDEGKKPTPVEVISNSTDTVGDRLVFQVKENIRGSQAFRLAKAGEPRVQLIINTIDLGLGAPGKATAFALVFTAATHPEKSAAGVYLDSMVGVCGAAEVKTMASQILARCDTVVPSFNIPTN